MARALDTADRLARPSDKRFRPLLTNERGDHVHDPAVVWQHTLSATPT